MERMLVVIFDKEKNAYEGSQALSELDREGSISIYAESVIQKHVDGTMSVKKAEEDAFPIRTIAGTALGSVIGLLGGPLGFGAGAAIGASAGMLGDFYRSGVNIDFLEDVSAKLTPGKFALLADVSEEWVTPVDTRMQALGGTVIRTAREQFEGERWTREVSAIRAEIGQLEAERAQARAEHKAKIQAKIENLNAKLQQKLDQAKYRTEEIKNETNSKVEALQQKAAKAKGEVKAAIDTRIADIKVQHEQATAKLRTATAEALRKAAAKLEKAS